jgi:hypothetical protein
VTQYDRPQPDAAGKWPLLATIAWVLALASLLEFALLRTASRTALHIPDVSQAQRAYDVGSDLGRYAYFVAVAALGATLLIAALRPSTRSTPTRLSLVLAVLAYAAAAALTASAAVAPAIPIALSVGAVAIAGALAASSDGRFSLIAALVMVAFGATAAWNIAQTAAATDGTWFLWVSELALVSMSLALPLALRLRLDKIDIAAGATAGLLLLGYSIGNPSTTGILLLWNGGLAGLLPAPFYAAALASAVAAIVALVRSGTGAMGAAVIVLVCAGATLQNTYQTGLLLAALLIVAASTRPGTVRAPETAATARNAADVPIPTPAH